MLRSRSAAGLLAQLRQAAGAEAAAPWWAPLSSLADVRSIATHPLFETASEVLCAPRGSAAWHMRSGGQQRRHGSGAASAAPQREQPGTQQQPSASSQGERLLLYRGRGIRPFRLLVRLKVFQLSGVAAAIVPVTTYFSEGSVSLLQGGVAAALLLGCGAASAALWYYSRRYVGELALLLPPPGAAGAAAAPPAVLLSVLDFWGNREDNIVPLGDLVPPLAGLPPAAAAAAAGEPALAVDVEGDRQYILSLRYGVIRDWPRLRALLEGDLHEQAGLQGQRGQGGGQPQANPDLDTGASR